MAHWIIKPHKSKDYDACIIPVNGEEDNRRALEYAMEVLEMLWDQAEEDYPVELSIELSSEPMPEVANDGA